MKNRPLLSVSDGSMHHCFYGCVGKRAVHKKNFVLPRLNDMPQKVIILPFAAKYEQETKENCRMIYLKENSIYSNSKNFKNRKLSFIQIPAKNYI